MRENVLVLFRSDLTVRSRKQRCRVDIQNGLREGVGRRRNVVLVITRSLGGREK